MKIVASDIDDLALGAVFLATGGGGDPYLPALIAKQTLVQTDGVTLIAPEALRDEDFVVSGKFVVIRDLTHWASSVVDALSHENYYAVRRSSSAEPT